MKHILAFLLAFAMLACVPTQEQPAKETFLPDAVEQTTAPNKETPAPIVTETPKLVEEITLFSKDNELSAHPIGQTIGAPAHWTYEKKVTGGTVMVDADIVLPDADRLYIAAAQPKTWTLPDIKQFIAATMKDKPLFTKRLQDGSSELWDGETVESFDYHATNPDWPVAGIQLQLWSEDNDNFYWFQRTDFDYGYSEYWRYCRGDCLADADHYPFQYREISQSEMDKTINPILGMTPQDAVDRALELMRPFGDYTLEDVVLALKASETDTGSSHPYYAVRLVRQINGLPIKERSCGLGSFSYLDNGVRIATGWQHDSILVNVDEKGVCAVDMMCSLNPPEIIGEATCVPFETIAEKLISVYAARCSTGHHITVTKIELCYVAVQNPDDPKSALIHPTWLFELLWNTPSMGITNTISGERNTFAIDAVTGSLLPD